MSASHPSSRRWFRRATSLFESMAKLRQRRFIRARLGVTALESRDVPAVNWPNAGGTIGQLNAFCATGDCDPLADPLTRNCIPNTDPGFSLHGRDGRDIDPGFSVPGGNAAAIDPGFSLPPMCAARSDNLPSAITEGNVFGPDGSVRARAADIFADGFGGGWGQTRSWSSAAARAGGSNLGNGWVDSTFPTLFDYSASAVMIVSNGTTGRVFDDAGGGVYTDRYFDQFWLTKSANRFTLRTQDGTTWVFNDTTNPVAGARGEVVSVTDARGNVVTVSRHATTGKVTEVTRGGTANGSNVTESWVYTYDASGRVSNVLLRRQVSGQAWADVRQVAYTYYETGESYGNAGDLKTATVKANNVAIGTYYYRYYKTGNFVGGLMYVLGPSSYDRAVGAVNASQEVQRRASQEVQRSGSR